MTVLVATIGAVASVVVAWIVHGLRTEAREARHQATKAREHAEAVNAAVNQRPDHEPNLYDLVRRVHERIDENAALGDRRADHVQRSLDWIRGHLVNLEGRISRLENRDS